MFFLVLLLGLVVKSDAGLKVQSEEFIAEDLALVSAEFGLVERGEDGTVRFKPTAKVPLINGQSYGWRVRLRTKRERVGLREEFELPVAPKVWNSPLPGSAFKVSPDGRTGITEVDAFIDDGVLTNGWSVAEGDPPGAHVIRLYIEGKLVRTFNFEVVAE
jgi:hypothetical protein